MAGADATLKIDINISQVEKKLSKTEQRLKKVKDLAASLGKAETALFDGRSIKGGNKALEELAGKLKAASQSTFKFANNVAGLDKQVGKLQSVIRSAKTDTDEFRNAIAAAERAQMSLFRARGSVMKTRGQDLMGGATGDLPGKVIADSSTVFRSIDALSNYRNELTRIFNAVEIGSPVFKQLEAEIKKVNAQLEKPKAIKTPNITRGIGGLAGREQALKEALRIQNQLETGSDAHIKSIVGVRKAQQAYNQELRVSKTIQSALNLDLIVWKKLLDSVPAIMGKIAGGMKGLFMGKFGKLGQAAGVITVSKAVQELIKIIPFLDQRLKNNIQQWALLTQRAVEGITGITVAWTALNGLLGGAQWVVGAVAGFAQFESAASKAIWTIEGQMTRAFSTFGRFARELPSMASALAMIMPESLGGMGVKGSFFDYLGDDKGGRDKLKETMLGGKERIEDKRYRRAGGETDLQKKQTELNQVNKALSQRNTTEKDYIQLLQRKFKLEKDVNREKRKQKVMEVKAGKPFEEVFSTEIDAAEKRRAKYNKEREESIKRGNKLIQDADARIAQAGKDKLKEVQNRWKLEATNHSKELKRIKERQAAERQRTAARKKAWGRFGENVMLGAGFPMLFGGGPGAVAGGLTGAIGQSAMGSQGFGMQILFSALGQQVDAFVGKASELGKAFSEINPDVDSVIASLGEANTAYGQHLATLKELKGDQAAMEEATKRLTQIIGKDGVASLEKFGEDSVKLGNAWQKFSTLMMTSVSELINSSGILLALTKAIGQAARFQSAYRAATEGDKEMALLFSMREGIEKRTHTGKFSDRQKAMKELEDWDKKIDQAELLRQSKGIGDLYGAAPGKDSKTKLQTLQEEREHLERSLQIGSKAAEQEREALELLKEQNTVNNTNLELADTDLLKGIQKRDQLKEQLEMWNQIKDTIAGGLTNAIMGLIDGTKTLAESLAGILKQLAQILINKAFTSWIGGLNFGGPSVGTQVGNMIGTFGEGGHVANGIKPFSTGGLVTRPTIGLVGEAGEDEYIIPSSKMQGAMERYSAGARGQGVIPGGGTVASGSGVSSSPTVVNYTGPVLSFNSEAYVPKSAIPEIINSAARRGAQEGQSKVMSQLKNSRSQRSRIGL